MVNAFSGLGFAPEAPVTYEFPQEMFDYGSDLTPLYDHFDDMIAGLMTWEPQGKLGLSEIQTAEIAGKDYPEAVSKLNNYFLRNKWSDGLPFVPPTEEYVEWLLTGTDEDPEKVVSGETGVMPRGGIATVRTVAAILAMCGGRPEHMPLLLAAMDIMCAKTSIGSWNATTNSCMPMFTLNGPRASQFRLGSGYGCLGPDPAHPTGVIIGRAVRLILQNLGGARPAEGTMAIFGGMRSTNAVFAEADELMPEGWTTIAEENGFSRNQDVLTMSVINSQCNMLIEFGTPEMNDYMLTGLAMISCYPNPLRYKMGMNGAGGVFLLTPLFAQSLRDANGYTIEDVKQFIWEKSKRPYKDLKLWNPPSFFSPKAYDWENAKDDDLIPNCKDPSGIQVIVCGGDQGGHLLFCHPFGGQKVSAEIKLPKNWDDLMLDAEIDLGPVSLNR